MNQEIWKDISGYEGLYQISSHGRIKSLERKARNKWGYVTVKEKIKKGFKRSGYWMVHLHKNTVIKDYLVHRLVAQAFIPGFDSEIHAINHLDGIRDHNNINNLEIATNSENMIHACNQLNSKKGKTSKYRNVSYCARDNLYQVAIQTYKIGRFQKWFKSEYEAAYAADQYLDSIGNKNRVRNFIWGGFASIVEPLEI